MKWVLASLLLVSVGCASTRPAPTETPRIDPLAFEIEDPEGRRAMLFGSVHIGRGDGWQLPDRVERALASAELLVLEIDLSKTSQDEMVQLTLGLGVMPPGQRLRQVVSAETWELLREHVEGNDASLEALNAFKPWVIWLQIVGQSLQSAGFDPKQGVEEGLVASQSQLPIRGLETPFEQLSIFDGLPYTVQDRMLLDALRPDPSADLDALLDAWQRGDARALEALVFKDRDDPQLARFYEEAYDLRNLRMAESIEEILAEGHRAFVVVGAGHLVGQRGIPTLLRDAGFRVRQVSGAR